MAPEAMLARPDPEGVMLAVLQVEEVRRPNLLVEAEVVCGMANYEHPSVAQLLGHTYPYLVGKKLEGIQLSCTMVSGRFT